MKKVVVLLVVALPLMMARAETCDVKSMPEWAEWTPVDLTEDSMAGKLASEALKEYTEGLQAASADLTCNWEGQEVQVFAACMQPGSTVAEPRYAVRFGYAVPCTVEGDEEESEETVVLSGLVEGEVPPPPKRIEDDARRRLLLGADRN
jgi:hypothetical protein